MLSDIRGKTPLMPQSAINLNGCTRGMIIKFKSFLHMFLIYEYILIIFCQKKKTEKLFKLKENVRMKMHQNCNITMTLMTSSVGNIVLKMLKVLCEYQTQQPIVMKFSDIVYA